MALHRIPERWRGRVGVLPTNLKITRGAMHCRSLYLHRPRGRVYSIRPWEVGSVREHHPLQLWSRFICVKAPKVPEGEPDSVPVPLPDPVPMPDPVPVPVPEPVYVPVPDPVHVADPKEDDRVSENFWDLMYNVFQILAAILSVLAALWTIFWYINQLRGGKIQNDEEAKKIDEALKKCDEQMHVVQMLLRLQIEVSKQMLEKMAADEKARKESWFFRFIGYK